MENLFSLPILTPEMQAQKGLQPISGLRLATMVKNNPNEQLTLLDIQPRISEGQYTKVGYIFQFMGKQFLLKLGETKANLISGMVLTPEVRTAKIDGNEIEYVVAV